MRSEFDEWAYNNGMSRTRDEEGYFSKVTQAASDAWQHQQSKIDELNQELHLVLNNWNDLTRAIHARTNGTSVAEARQLHEKVGELQKRVDLLEGKIKEALNTVYVMKGKADCDHLTDKEQSFVYGFGYELHEILKEDQALTKDIKT